MNKKSPFNSGSRHAECRACGKRIGMEYKESLHEITFCNEAWTIDKRQCKKCGFVDFSARSKDSTGIVVLSAINTECSECDSESRVTIVNPESLTEDFFHFCDEHSSKALRLVRNHIDAHQRMDGHLHELGINIEK